VELKRKLMKRMLRGKQMPFNITFLLFFLWRLRYAHRIKQSPSKQCHLWVNCYMTKLSYVKHNGQCTIYKKYCSNGSSHCICVRYNDLTCLCFCGLFMLLLWDRCTIVIYTRVFFIVFYSTSLFPFIAVP